MIVQTKNPHKRIFIFIYLLFFPAHVKCNTIGIFLLVTKFLRFFITNCFFSITEKWDKNNIEQHCEFLEKIARAKKFDPTEEPERWNEVTYDDVIKHKVGRKTLNY